MVSAMYLVHVVGDAQNSLILFSIFNLTDLEQPCVACTHFRFIKFSQFSPICVRVFAICLYILHADVYSVVNVMVRSSVVFVLSILYASESYIFWHFLHSSNPWWLTRSTIRSMDTGPNAVVASANVWFVRIVVVVDVVGRQQWLHSIATIIIICVRCRCLRPRLPLASMHKSI